MVSKPRLFAVAAALLWAGAPAGAEGPANPVFVTLGTMAGPISNPQRSQPANLLLWGDQAILIDAGDGAAEQLARAGVELAEIDAIFISHHHFDHTGGLFALLGMRYQTRVASPLAIYGPPGTARLVAGLVAAMAPAVEVGAGYPGAARPSADAGLTVVEMRDGDHIALGGIAVTAARNSHYSYAEGSAEAAQYQSLSFRFDAPGRAIVYTGDTGPSPAVERLAHNADLLVSEVIDVEGATADLLRARPDLPPMALVMIERHFREQHLTAGQAGQLARAAGVHQLVLTHVAIGGRDPEQVRAAAAAAFGGSVTVAVDLARY